MNEKTATEFTMVKRIAKVVGKTLGDKYALGVHSEIAYAVLEEMREPTGPMLTAMRIDLGGTDQLHIDEAEEAWRNGVDAALKEHSLAESSLGSRPIIAR